MTKDQIAEYERMVQDKANGRLLNPDGIAFICASHHYEAEAIGMHFLELLPSFGVSVKCNDATDPAVAVPEYIARITAILGKPINKNDIIVIDRKVPHEKPKHLTPGKMAVYTFLYGDEFLKIGIVGENSNARYTSQHYNPKSAQSTLAQSILSDPDMAHLYITEDNVGAWIQNNCRRIDFELPGDLSIFARDLIEKILHYKYEPKYEGFSSQRKKRPLVND